VRRRIPPALVLLALAAICGGSVLLVAWLRERSRTTADWLGRLPPGEAVIVYVDWEALTRAGFAEWLGLSRLAEEPEYRAFVEQSGFDPRRDLQAALIAFHPEGAFFLLRGRFDWSALARFVAAQGGVCYNSFCRVAGSRPERKISYFPLRRDVMALAVSRDAWAAQRLQARRAQSLEAPEAPLWSLAPAESLKTARELPPGTRLFAKAMAGAERLAFWAAPRGDRLELHAEVTCRSAEQAGVLAAQLRGLTQTLREMIAREQQQPNPRDLSGVLTAGVFEQQGRRVRARWPLQRPFLESLAGSGW
jgi:hypothetical protein